jgi:hypothetical protein
VTKVIKIISSKKSWNSILNQSNVKGWNWTKNSILKDLKENEYKSKEWEPNLNKNKMTK